MNLTKFNNVVRSKTFQAVMLGLGIVIAALLIFQAGVSVGYRKASFSYRWGENYHRNFGGPRGGFLRGKFTNDFVNPHGVFGQIIRTDPPIITIQGRDAEKTIIVNGKTVIRKFRDALKSADLKVNDSVVVVGDPNEEGQIEAKLIRVFDPKGAEETKTRSWFGF